MKEVGTNGDGPELRDPLALPVEPIAPPPDSELVLKKPRMWPFFVVLLVIAGGVSFAIVRFQRKPEPLRVLVAIDYDGMPWEASKASARLSDSVCELLKKVGFEPVKTGDPDVDKVLLKAKTPEDAARSLKAAFVITGKLTPAVTEEKLPVGSEAQEYFEARVDGDVFIREIDDPKDKVGKGHVSNWSGALTKDDAIQTITDGISSMVFDEVAPRMMSHPVIQEVLDSGDVRLLTQIQDAKKFVERRKRLLDDVKKRYDDLAKAHQSTPQPIRKITYYGSFDEDDSLASVGPDGFLIQTANVSPLVSPDSPDLGRIIRLETLEWRSPDGGDPRVVWKGYHLYGYPSAAVGGNPVVFVEDLFGRAKTVTVVDNGQARRVRIDPTYRFVDPQIAPGGAAAAMLANRCRDCPSGLLVMSLTDGKTLHERQGDDRYGGYTWLDAHRVAYFVKARPAEGIALSEDENPPSAIPKDIENSKDKATEPTQTFDLAIYDTQSNAVSKVAGYDKDDAFAFPAASPDGKLIAVGHRSEAGQFLAVIDVATGKLTDVTKAPGGANPSFSPDGTMVTYTDNGDIRLFHIKEGTVDELTKNGIEELYPKFSADGSRIFFESRDSDPNFSRNRYIRVIASVPVRP